MLSTIRSTRCAILQIEGDITLTTPDAARNRLQNHFFHDRRYHQDIHLSFPPPYLRSHIEVSSHRQRHLSLPAHKLHFTRTILVLLPMLACSGHVGQDILRQARAAREVLVNIGCRKYTECNSRRHGLCPASYTDCRALESEAEQDNEDPVVHCVLNGLLVLCGQRLQRTCTKDYKQRHYLYV